MPRFEFLSARDAHLELALRGSRGEILREYMGYIEQLGPEHAGICWWIRSTFSGLNVSERVESTSSTYYLRDPTESALKPPVQQGGAKCVTCQRVIHHPPHVVGTGQGSRSQMASAAASPRSEGATNWMCTAWTSQWRSVAITISRMSAAI